MRHPHRFFPVGLAILPAACGLIISTGAWANEHHNPDKMFQMMDTNGDGKISPEEHEAGAKKMFEKMDANKDGKVTAAEMDAAHDEIAGKAGKAHMKAPMMSSAEKIKVLDTNHDGVLSEEEHVAGAKMMFDKMDADKDGLLTKAEMEAGHAKMMSRANAKDEAK
jgi:Ca2+-binding EF-hand superfamily protein